MDHRPQAWGRVSATINISSLPYPNGKSWNHITDSCAQPRDDVYGAYDHSYMQENGPKQNTQQPIVTGTSVIGIKFKDGVVIAADNLG